MFSFVGLLDPNGVVLEANKTALDGVDLRREDVIGRPFWETAWWAASPEVRARLRDAIVRARGGETVRYDATRTTPATNGSASASTRLPSRATAPSAPDPVRHVARRGSPERSSALARVAAMSDADAANLALLAFRAAIGAVMLAHGINHIFGGGKIKGTAGWFGSLGMKPGIFHAWLASITEIAGGTLLVLGLLTPLGGAAVIGVMLVAWITNHRGNGFFIFRPGEGWEYVMTLTFCGLVLAVVGAGEWSLDEAFGIGDDLFGVTGLLIALIGGAGGAAALLLGFWRPEPKES